ncbi:hypothetical protein G7059_08010 [Erysipelothrix sp. HDW6A]|uniref:hypothetical protein n=1 Tax=Erysipelothrix sp. HDW6A TaxID=2714928 RepID=UPI00140DAE19|nr:hypothetical protein [Erysipelothrix sp. HDW6A]QIK57786.1 hypothetical protein G7059_08010 [Erysipelothrix sp. HDW6A]
MRFKVSGDLGGMIVILAVFGVSFGICSWIVETAYRYLGKSINSRGSFLLQFILSALLAVIVVSLLAL